MIFKYIFQFFLSCKFDDIFSFQCPYCFGSKKTRKTPTDFGSEGGPRADPWTLATTTRGMGWGALVKGEKRNIIRVVNLGEFRNLIFDSIRLMVVFQCMWLYVLMFFSPFRRDDPLWCCRCRVEMHEDLDWITDFARLNHIISIFSDVFSCFFPTRFQPWAHLKRALAITGFCWGRDFEKLWIWRIKFRYVFTVFCIQRSDVKEKCQRELIALEGEHGN